MQPDPVPVPSLEAIEALPAPLSACPDCGYVGIRPARAAEGAYAGGGELLMSACPRCGYRGQPVEFARPADYAKFVEELHAPS